MNKPISLYVHIPFCKHICSYCDFCKVYYNDEWVEKYLDALEEELKQRSLRKDLYTLYIGGGTPSSLNNQQLERLLSLLEPYSKEVKEYTIEVNPETITEEKIILFKKYGISRLSIGVQTLNEDLLKKIERYHSNKDVYQTIELAKKHGIDNLSIDLMYDLPDQTLQDIESDIVMALSLPITHLSYYALILEDHTQLKLKNYQHLDDETLAKMEEILSKYLEEASFYHYEVSNYAKMGYHSLHNCVYWENNHYYGLGLRSSGYEDHCRYTNTSTLMQYLHQEFRYEKEELTIKDERFNALMLGLRMVKGIDLDMYKERYHEDLYLNHQVKIDKYLKLNLLEIKNQHLRATKQGMNVLNEILEDFLEEF